MCIPVLYIIMKKNQNAKKYQNVLHNMVNPYAIWFKNINTKSIYHKGKILVLFC